MNTARSAAATGQEPKQMSISWWMFTNFFLPIVIAAAGIAGAATIIASKQEPKREPPKVVVPVVEVATVKPAPEFFPIVVNGVVTPKREVTLRAEVRGRIVTKAAEFDAGRFVRSGTVLAEIDRRTYDLEVQRLESNLLASQVDLLELDKQREDLLRKQPLAEKTVALRRTDLKNSEDLVLRGATSDTSRDLLEIQFLEAQRALFDVEKDLEINAARRKGLEAQVGVQQALLSQAKLDVERTKIIAPIDGVVTNEAIERDDFVQIGDTVARVEDATAVEVKCSLRLEDLNWLWLSQPRGERLAADGQANPQTLFQAPHAPAVIRYSTGGNTYTWTGHLSRYEGVGLTEATRTLPCLIEVPNRLRAVEAGGPPVLVRGMFVSVELQAKPADVPLLQVPRQALQPGDELWVCRANRLYVHKARVARRLRSFVGGSLEGDTASGDGDVLIHALNSGIEAGDEVVITPLVGVVDAMEVRLADSPTLPKPDAPLPAPPATKTPITSVNSVRGPAATR